MDIVCCQRKVVLRMCIKVEMEIVWLDPYKPHLVYKVHACTCTNAVHHSSTILLNSIRCSRMPPRARISEQQYVSQMPSRIPAAKTFVYERMGYEFHDNDLLFDAIDATGLRPERLDGNKRLAIVGDAVIRLHLVDLWYPTGASKGSWPACLNTCSTNRCLSKGDAQDLVSELASNNYFNEVSLRLGLDEYIINHPGSKDQFSPYTLATAFEAIIGAIWLDSGKSVEVIKKILDTTLQSPEAWNE